MTIINEIGIFEQITALFRREKWDTFSIFGEWTNIWSIHQSKTKPTPIPLKAEAAGPSNNSNLLILEQK